ncbi:DUF2690 domain-containing protein [Streptomyces sp. NPDC089919]|uniref:DUF2690 domain-containing protein n=1 Tax=Streptomyces sp. NPDC089919 TaxID=3155188 RepID=UPI00341B9BDA
MKRSLGVLLLSLGLVAAPLGGVAAAKGGGQSADGHPAARASAGCYGSSCTGRDPIAMGCSGDAITVEGKSTTSGRIELRYSSACGANWARLVNGAGYYYQVDNARGEESHFTASSANSWTDMVDGTVYARACVYNSGWTCTDFH